MKTCQYCKEQITSKKAIRWCSERCAKLGLKRDYRQRNRIKVNLYKTEYRKRYGKTFTAKQRLWKIELLGSKCERCKSANRLHVHHIRPLRQGGTNYNSNLMLLCSECHTEWHKRIGDFFTPPLSGASPKKVSKSLLRSDPYPYESREVTEIRL